jgi:cytochrome b6-f complex iron-sulfur subunit
MENSTPSDTPVQSKRDFLKSALWTGFIAWLAAILYPVISYLKPPKVVGAEVNSIKVMKASEIAANEGKVFRFGDTPGILIRTKTGDLHALSATCTHLDCTVQYKSDIEMIWCACHNGKYDVTGRNVSGPPPKPLAEYKVIVKDGDIYVSKT